MSVTNNYSLSSVALSSFFTAQGKKMTATSTATQSTSATVDNLPIGAVVTSVVLLFDSSNSGYADALYVVGSGNGTSVQNDIRATECALNFDGILAGNSTVSFAFTYKAKTGAPTSQQDGVRAASTVQMSNIVLAVTYEADEPAPPPTPDATDIPEYEPTRGQHIVVYAPDETEFNTLGLAVLRPTECTVKQAAGGEYNLHLTQPITLDGLWRFLTDNAIIKAPVPKESIPYINGEYIADAVRYTNAQPATKYSNMGGYKRITYNAWQRQVVYPVGARVTHNDQNYECLVQHWSLAFDSSKWKTIPNYASTPATAVGTTPAGTIIIAVSVTGGWINGSVEDTGETGYWKLEDFEQVLEPGEGTPARDIVEQCFRINKITRDSKDKTVEVEATQLTYDWAMSVVKTQIDLSTAPDALTLKKAVREIRNNASNILKYDAQDQGKPGIYYQIELVDDPEHPGQQQEKCVLDSKVSSDYSFQTVTYCVLDPDSGLVKAVKARLVRDLWSFYLLEDEKVDRGFRIEYGVNMLGVTWNRDSSKLVTRIFPRAKGSNGKDIVYYTDPTTGNAYIDSTRINEYPIVFNEALDTGLQIGKDEVTNENVQERMREVALKRFSEDLADCIEETIEVDFLMLGDSEEYKQYRRLQRVSLYDMVTCVHVPLGLVATAQVKEYEWDAIRKRFNKITLGNPWTYGLRTVYGYDIGNGVIQYSKLSTDAILRLKET